MTDRNISIALQSIREFHKSVATFLRTADGLMKERGFEVHPTCGNVAVADYSTKLSLSDKWTPEFVFRWYAVPEQPNVLAWVAVLLCPRPSTRSKPGFQIRNADTPLASAGWMEFPEGVPPTGSRFFHYARSFWWADHPPDGSWSPEYQTGQPVERSAMAHPLTAIGTAENIREKLTDPLADQLRVVWGVSVTPKVL